MFLSCFEGEGDVEVCEDGGDGGDALDHRVAFLALVLRDESGVKGDEVKIELLCDAYGIDGALLVGGPVLGWSEASG